MQLPMPPCLAAKQTLISATAAEPVSAEATERAWRVVIACHASAVDAIVMQAVCVILDVKPAKAKDDAGKPINDYWKPSVALLNEKDFLNKLKSYDKDNINPKLIDKIRTSYLTNEGFTPENAKKASPAAEGMCKWVHAMSSYEKVCFIDFISVIAAGSLKWLYTKNCTTARAAE